MAGIIARASPDFATSGEFVGTVVGSGFPNRCGKLLYGMYHGTAASIYAPLAGSIDHILDYIARDNFHGWWSLDVVETCQCHSKPWRDKSKGCRCNFAPRPYMEYTGPVNDSGGLISGYNFAYIVDPGTSDVHVLTPAVQSGKRKLYTIVPEEETATRWLFCGTFNLDQLEPDWDVLSYGFAQTRLKRHYNRLYSPRFLTDNQRHYKVAHCPYGHEFHGLTGYQHGDLCLGPWPHYVVNGSKITKKMQRETKTPMTCDHVFRLDDYELSGSRIVALPGAPLELR